MVFNEVVLHLDHALDLVEEELDGLLPLLLDPVNIVLPSLYTAGLSNSYVMLVALLHQVSKLGLRLFTLLDLLCKWKVVWRLLDVDVNEVSLTHITDVVNHLPTIILSDLHLEKCHVFRPV